MTDIVLRLRHCADNCGDEYLRELSGRAADEIERLKAALAYADAKGQENDKLLWGTIKDNERLRAEIKLLSHPTSTGTNATDYGLRTTRAALKEDGDA